MGQAGIQREVMREQFRIGMQFIKYKGKIRYFEVLAGQAHIKDEQLMLN